MIKICSLRAFWICPINFLPDIQVYESKSLQKVPFYEKFVVTKFQTSFKLVVSKIKLKFQSMKLCMEKQHLENLVLPTHHKLEISWPQLFCKNYQRKSISRLQISCQFSS